MQKSGQHISENDLATMLQNGDQAVVSEIYDRYGGVLFGMCTKILRNNTGLAEDAFQESVLKIWKYGKSYDAKKGKLFTWMLNITKNTAIDHWRKNMNRGKIQNDIEDVHKAKEAYSETRNTDTMDVPENVESLDQSLREVIELAYFNGMTHQQISGELDIPLGTVKTRIRNGIKKLRTIYLKN
ncbi:RNA polymerase sigma factor [Membranihabitans maritimus]|uniref:RNA polymerase sigma factor n=1 Tax=Membranihabitans maritimus TaxID=2904244 RepID=UPI001F0245F6|nr:sigma-70 family RNA polymerase sigma factor [Membranihabitans maritimus]